MVLLIVIRHDWLLKDECKSMALYGLKQATHQWFDKFNTTICNLGFTDSTHENALFIRKSECEIVLLLLYVDDMIITRDDIDGIFDLKASLLHTFEMKDLSSLSYFLDLEVIFSNDGIYLSQAKYVSDFLARVNVTDSRTESTPLEPNVRFTPMDGTILDNPSLYRQLVGVHVLSQFLSAPRTTHYAVVLCILRYIKGTLFHGLHFFSHSSLTIQAYLDVDWTDDPTDLRSITGYWFFLGESLIFWRAKNQTFTAQSSTEAEYRALADTTAEIGHNDVFHEHTKHIEIDCHFVRKHLLIDVIHFVAVGVDQTTDIFMDAHHPTRCLTLVSKLKMTTLSSNHSLISSSIIAK
ncbi:uncharacterized protein LOC107636196 [Arachis ipaensis]|uniref:uncharacterized protein LOC107636196 n=1 Tax=Arachis ipaensis TaxID=130454 RepID=UPI0007AF871C|nr:uncharacterized protein LOC107636196 [Arachis ipaensis]XP_025647393.1 uncharacterized protein LOC112742371 [Arachis hypogaea]